MENKLTPELIAKAKLAKSAEELIALAKENGAQLTAEEANTYFDELNKSGEISDDELDGVSGGCGERYYHGHPIVENPDTETCEYFQDRETWEIRPEGGHCGICRQVGRDGNTWICWCPERYND